MTESEFAERIEETRKKLFLIALSITKNKEDAEDAVSNAILRALGKYKSFGERDNFDGYMVTLTANEAKRLRSAQRYYDNVYELSDAFSYDHGGDMEFFDMIERSGLNVKSRKILVLRFLYGYTLPDIAKILRISEASAKAEYYRGLRKIKETVEKK